MEPQKYKTNFPTTYCVCAAMRIKSIQSPATEVKLMVILSDDEVALIRSLLTALRGIKVRDIDKAMVILAKADKRSQP